MLRAFVPQHQHWVKFSQHLDFTKFAIYKWIICTGSSSDPAIDFLKLDIYLIWWEHIISQTVTFELWFQAKVSTFHFIETWNIFANAYYLIVHNLFWLESPSRNLKLDMELVQTRSPRKDSQRSQACNWSENLHLSFSSNLKWISECILFNCR